MLTACGGGGDAPESVQIETSSALKEVILESEEIASEEPEQESVLTDRERRDALELEQLLDYTSDRQEELSEITVDLSEESEEISRMGQEAVNAVAVWDTTLALEFITGETWMDTMLPGLVIGRRNYSFSGENYQALLTVEADELGRHYTAVQCVDNTDKISYLELTDSGARAFTCTMKDGTYSGDFISCRLELEGNYYMSCAGTLSDVGRVKDTLEVTVVSPLTPETELTTAQLWAEHPGEEAVFTGTFDESGHTALETPESLKGEGRLAYASSAKKGSTDYLAVETEESAEEYVFTAPAFGCYTYWDD
jgi:hypothetical protein